jgi:hypothetical protein
MPVSRVTVGAIEDLYGPGSVDYSKADPYTCGQTNIVGAAAEEPGKEDNIKLLLPVGHIAIPNVPEREPLQTTVDPVFADVGTPVPGVYRRGAAVPTVAQSRPSSVDMGAGGAGAAGAPTGAAAPPVPAAAVAPAAAPPAPDASANATAPPAPAGP